MGAPLTVKDVITACNYPFCHLVPLKSVTRKRDQAIGDEALSVYIPLPDCLPSDPVSRPLSESDDRYTTWFFSSFAVISLFPEQDETRIITARGKTLMRYFIVFFLFMTRKLVTDRF